jgi:adenylylsulfate kinase|tara:strand:- start:147 stop:566 length:420 start_codon:yes stop_codon:yes gene_type:complete
MRILIMGLPGAGKTHLAKRLHVHLNCAWYNADKVREMANDWDFSDAGRRRQSERMNTLATFEGTRGRTVICDFVCPTGETRKEFNADITIWMDTIEAGRFDDTNKIFEEPTEHDFRIKGFMPDEDIVDFAKMLKDKYHV